MGLRDFKNEIMWNCVITGNVLCAELYTSSRNTIISNETCRYIIPGCYTKRTSEIEIILQENRNRYARDTHLFPHPTIVKNTPLIYLLSWIIMYSIQSFFKIRKSESKRILRSFSLFQRKRKKKERIGALERDPKRRVRIAYFDFTTRVARHSIRFVVRIRN